MFLKIALVCMSPLIINHSDTWTERDSQVVIEAAARCEAHYPNAPCVKYFLKKAEQDYHVICGAPELEEGEEVEIE
jgi:hypothetical protein